MQANGHSVWPPNTHTHTHTLTNELGTNDAPPKHIATLIGTGIGLARGSRFTFLEERENNSGKALKSSSVKKEEKCKEKVIGVFPPSNKSQEVLVADRPSVASVTHFLLSFYNKEDAIDQKREGVQCSEVPQKWSVSGSKCCPPQSESECVCLDKQVQKGGRLRQSQARSTLSELFAFVQCSMRGKERRTSEERQAPHKGRKRKKLGISLKFPESSLPGPS